MAEASLKLGGSWATKEDSLLGYNSENGNYKPIPFDFSRASIGTRVNRDGLIEVVQDNIPRIDFSDNADGALLLEPQRTNLITYSEDFSNAAWVKSGNGTGLTPVITLNAALSPDGTLNASKIDLDLNNGTGSGDWSWVYFNFTGTGDDKTISYWIKAADSNNVGKVISIGSFSAQSYTLTDNWVRVESTSSGSGGFGTILRLRGTESTSNTASFYIYGAQLEAGSYSTSYIPTSGSAVTRVYDFMNVSGLNADVFYNDNFTLLYDFDYNADGREGSTTAYRVFSGSSQLGIKGRSGSSRSMEVFSSGDFSGSIVFNNIENASRIKVALRVTNGTCELFFNGAKDTETIDVSAASPYNWGVVEVTASGSINTSLNQCLGFPTALTDLECIELTTL